jgi:indolepyruvate ferredoxin oxidoreductase beta subunit
MTAPARPIKVTVAALGGQGGGVVADWLIDVARHENYLVQSTSVPGVAQRTGATIYYLEFFPRSGMIDGREPVLALMPHPGDVDVVIASELAESGRVILRGIVTPDRTTLITSTHRAYTISEKSALGDGRTDSAALLATARAHAKRLIAYDMEAVANEHRAVISAVILGGLAGSGTLPFATESYREAIRQAGIAVAQNLAAFDASARAAAGAATGPAAAVAGAGSTPKARSPRVQQLLDRIAREFPAPAGGLLIEGVRQLIDYQDVDYAAEYLDRLAPFKDDLRLLETLARGLALWMSFEDTIRVADLKTRGARVTQIRGEVRAEASQLVQVTEFMKPRVEEICGTLPAGLGRAALRSASFRSLLGRFTKDRQISTSTISGFLLLRTIARMGRWRRSTLRYVEEHANIAAWLALIERVRSADAALANEIADCQQLVKGYGDTHANGLRNFTRIMNLAGGLVGRADAAALVRRWRVAALKDEGGVALEQELATPPAAIEPALRQQA